LKKDYIYAATRIHGHEQRLLSELDMERLMASKSVGECLSLLADKGWRTAGVSNNAFESIFALEREKTWQLIEELLGDLSELNIFLYENDFHNLKAAIKLVYTREDGRNTEKYFRLPGTIEPKAMLEAVRQRDFDELPHQMAQAGQEAHNVLVHTDNGQACDMIIDKAALLAIDAEGKVSKSELIRYYAKLKVDTANIKAAVRGCRMGKDEGFLARAIANAGSLNSAALIEAAAKSLEDIYAYLSQTEYAKVVDALRQSLAAFERWCDNALMDSIQQQRYEFFTIDPLVAYIIARESEMGMVRLILSAKVNSLDDAAVRNRWRQTYV
jgi:V/A-type H+-transporting ATPase subunit C